MDIRLMLVDDHGVVRRGLRSYLEAYDDIQVVAEADSGEDALDLIGERVPDVVVMDLMMPGGMDGIETTRQARAISPHTQVVVLTAHTGDERVIAALRAGAIGYVRKDSAPEVLLNAVRMAAVGQAVLDPQLAGSVLNDLVSQSAGVTELTDREQDVIRLLAHGKTNAEIAGDLVIGDETVKTHVGNILSKLHLTHRTQAAIYALKKGLIDLDDIDL